MTRQDAETGLLPAMLADAQAVRRRNQFRDGPTGGGRPKPETYGKTEDRRRDIARMTQGRWVALADIAATLGLSRCHTSTILRGMLADGLIERRTVPTKSRRGGARIAEWRASNAY